MLALTNIGFRVNGHAIITDVTLTASYGEIVALIGPNGSGKTTLFNVINGFLRHTSGNIAIAGTRADNLTVEQRIALGVGRLWQDVRIFQKMSCLENLVVAVKNSPGEALWRAFVQPKKIKLAEKEAIDKAEQYLKLTGLIEKRNIEAENLSYGQQKLLAMCRLFMNDATILLLDEPYAGVSSVLFDRISALIEKMRKLNQCILIIEHNIALVQWVSQRMYAFDEGRIIAEGTPREVMGSIEVKEAYAGV